jgi:3-phosphoshikimate 1-carboxyvinyltransferase
MKIKPAGRIKGTARLPGDKSISHRAAIIASLAGGTSNIANFSTSGDCAATLSCLRQLGVSIEQSGHELLVEGVGDLGFRAPVVALDCGNSGTTMRLLAGVLAGQDFSSELTGDSSLLARPMKRIIEPLSWMGAVVESEGGKPPLRITGREPLQGVKYNLSVASAQVKSCILLAALQAKGRTEIVETNGVTRDHTERMLEWFGVNLDVQTSTNERKTIALDGPVDFKARDIDVPGDVSSASFFVAAAAVLPKSELEVKAVGLNLTRIQFLSTLHALGFALSMNASKEVCNEPVGTIRVSGKSPPAKVAPGAPHLLEGSLIPPLIDELPLLAVVGTQISGGIEIRNAEELRFKESDRISATARNLRAMGATVDEYDDGLTVAGPTQLRGAKLESFGDHRIAMTFSIAALLAETESEIKDAECVAVSFPEFYSLLDSVVER